MLKLSKSLENLLGTLFISLQLITLAIVILAITSPFVLQIYLYTFTSGRIFLGISILLGLFIGYGVFKAIKEKSLRKLSYSFVSQKERVTSLLIIFLCLAYLGFIIMVVIPLGGYFISHLDDKQVEQATEKEIRDIVAKHPEMHVERLVLWEGDSTDTLSIKDKGKVDFWYRKSGHPRIESVTTTEGKTYITSFDCENNDNGKRSNAYTYGLEVIKGSPLGHLFSFEINTLEDLSSHFNDLVKTLDTLPRLKETETMIDQSGTREVVKNPDLKYLFKPNPGEKAMCYYYIKVTDSSGEPWKK